MISVITPTIRPEGLEIVKKCLEEQTYRDFEWLVEVGLPKKDGHDLNRAFNRMLKRAKGDLIVIYQDYIKIESDTLSKVWAKHQEKPDVFFTCPVGKTLDWENVTWDWRNNPDNKEISWQQWEIDLGFAPKKALFEIGGFDEELDTYWSFDNPNVAYRAFLAGYKFENTQDIRGIAYDHDAKIPHPFREKYNPAFHNERLRAFERGLKLDYLR